MTTITRKRLGVLFWMVENKEKTWTMLQASKSTGLSYCSVHELVRQLVDGGILTKVKGGFKMSNMRVLVNQIAYAFPFRSHEKTGYFLPGDMLEKMKLVKGTGLRHAFTLFSAGEMLHPYITTKDVHVYIDKKEQEQWKKKLLAMGARRASEEANLYLLPAEDFYFTLSKTVNNFVIAPTGAVLADLISFGGLGEEQAAEIMR